MRRNIEIAYVLLPVATLCWAGNHIVGRAMVGHVPPGGLSVFRWILASLILAPFALPHLKRDWPALVDKAGIVVFLSLIGAGVFSTLQFMILQHATAINMSVFNSFAPIMILLASYLLFKDRLRSSQVIGVSTSLAGILSIIAQGEWSRLRTMTFAPGDLMIIANMALWAIYCACLRLRPAVHWLSFTFVMMVISAITNVPFAIWERAHGQILAPTPLTLFSILYAAVCTSVLAYACWNRGVELIGASRASGFLHLVPIFGALLASLILGERLHPYHVAGFVLIIAGVTLASRPPRPAG